MAIVEQNDSVSPNSGGFAPEGGKAEWNYDVSGEDLVGECLAIVGGNRRLNDGTGRIDRQIPRVHPQMPWLMATGISSFRGVGLRDEANESSAELTDSAAADDLPAVTDAYLRYARYDVRVNFEAPAFALRTNDDVGSAIGEWFDDDGQQGFFQYAEEWIRFTDAPRSPEPEFIQYKQGQALFRSTNPKPNKFPFAGLVRIAAPKQAMMMTWLRVPESYVLSVDSYLERFLWRVNQNQWLDFRPGQCLYRGYKVVRRGTPPFPDELEGFPGVFGTEKVIDLELNFGICRFACEDAPVPANMNWVASGWNLFHWAGDRRPHYVSAVGVDPSPDPNVAGPPDPDVESKRVPTYRSCPMELLFTDPDLSQPFFGTLNVGG